MEALGNVGIFVGAAAIGLVHGAEPGHGWPIAAAYALDRKRTWFHGLAASTLLGVGHLISSIAVVLAFFLAKSSLELGQVTWLKYVAGLLLIGMGIREYTHQHDHGHGGGREDDHGDSQQHTHDHGHEHVHSTRQERGDDHDHAHEHEHGHSHEPGSGHTHEEGDSSLLDRLRGVLPFSGHSHDHGSHFEGADREGLASLVTTAFVLGFVHEEEFEIIGLCLGSISCLALMFVYAFAVIVGLVGLTLLLIAGYVRYEERVESYTDYLPTISAAVLILMGIAFILGFF